jgi:hypothetical protein
MPLSFRQGARKWNIHWHLCSRGCLPDMDEVPITGAPKRVHKSVNAARTSAYATSNSNGINRLRVVQRNGIGLKPVLPRLSRLFKARHRSGDLSYRGQGQETCTTKSLFLCAPRRFSEGGGSSGRGLAAREEWSPRAISAMAGRCRLFRRVWGAVERAAGLWRPAWNGSSRATLPMAGRCGLVKRV